AGRRVGEAVARTGVIVARAARAAQADGRQGPGVGSTALRARGPAGSRAQVRSAPADAWTIVVNSRSNQWRLAACGLAGLVVALLLVPGRASAAVTISSFMAQWQGSQVVLNWTTASELNNQGFFVLRGDSSDGAFTALNSASMVLSHCIGQV